MCDILSCNFRPVTNRYKIYVFIIYDNCEFSNVLLKKSLSIHYDTNSHVWTDEKTDNNNFTSLHLLSGDSQGRKTVRNQRSVFKKNSITLISGHILHQDKTQLIQTLLILSLSFLWNNDTVKCIYRFASFGTLVSVLFLMVSGRPLDVYNYSFQQQLLRYFLK